MKRKRAPLVYVWSSFTSAPSRSAMMLQMCSPSPEPCTLPSSFLYRSKMSFAISGGMPVPVSVTEKVSLPGSPWWRGADVSRLARCVCRRW